MKPEQQHIDDYRRSFAGAKRLTYTLLVILLTIIIICLSGCASTVPSRYEGQIIKTRVYAGHFLTSYYHEPYTRIITDQDAFLIEERITIPRGQILYVLVKPCLLDVHPDIARKLEKRYLEVGAEKYRIRNSN